MCLHVGASYGFSKPFLKYLNAGHVQCGKSSSPFSVTVYIVPGFDPEISYEANQDSQNDPLTCFIVVPPVQTYVRLPPG